MQIVGQARASCQGVERLSTGAFLTGDRAKLVARGSHVQRVSAPPGPDVGSNCFGSGRAAWAAPGRRSSEGLSHIYRASCRSQWHTIGRAALRVLRPGPSSSSPYGRHQHHACDAPRRARLGQLQVGRVTVPRRASTRGRVVSVHANQNLSEEEAWKKRQEDAAKDGVAPQTGEWCV